MENIAVMATVFLTEHLNQQNSFILHVHKEVSWAI